MVIGYEVLYFIHKLQDRAKLEYATMGQLILQPSKTLLILKKLSREKFLDYSSSDPSFFLLLDHLLRLSLDRCPNQTFCQN